MSRARRGDDPSIEIVVFFGVLLAPAIAGFFSGSCAAFTMLLFAVLSALALTRQRAESGEWWRRSPQLLAVVLFVPVVTSFVGFFYGNKYDKQRATAERERLEAEASAAAFADARQAREERGRSERAAEAQRRQTALVLAEAQRTPSDRAFLIFDLLNGRVDAGSADPLAALCAARRQASRIGEGFRGDPRVSQALHALARAERDALRRHREEFRQYRMVACCDGTTSPSCECSRASHRGCCSHHGGMCGCEPLPTEITCTP